MNFIYLSVKVSWFAIVYGDAHDLMAALRKEKAGNTAIVFHGTYKMDTLVNIRERTQMTALSVEDYWLSFQVC